MTDVIANPVTGEVLEPLQAASPETLAEALVALRGIRKEMAGHEKAVEEELRRRIQLKTGGQNRLVIFGHWEVQAKPSNRREWDWEALHDVLRDLYHQGILNSQDILKVNLRREWIGSGAEAARLYERLSGAARALVGDCFQWVKRQGTVEVARSVELPPAITPSRSPLAQVIGDPVEQEEEP